MPILSQISDSMQQLLTPTSEEAAHNSGLVRRKRKLTGSSFVQTLVFGWLANPEATYAQLAQTAGTLGIPITRQAIFQRLTPQAANTLKVTLESVPNRASLATTSKPPYLRRVCYQSPRAPHAPQGCV